MFRLARFAITLVMLLVWASSPALACGLSDAYDQEQEEAAIKKALPDAQLTAPQRAEMARLMRIMSVSLKHTTGKGQSRARGEAMTMLGIARIPLRPEREFSAIRDKLQSLAQLSASETEAKQLRDEAEKQWAAREYDRSRETLRKALKLLYISIVYFRC